MNKQKKFGFTLIELVIGIAIAAVISVILFNSFYQTYKTVTSIDKMISIDRRVSVLQNQLDKDLSAIFIPPLEHEKIERYFYSTNAQKNLLKECTFITTNSLQVYKSTNPRIVRVTYQLFEDKISKGSYTLMRKESTNLTYGAEKDAVGYVLANDIKSFSLQFASRDKKNNQKKSSNEWISKTENTKNPTYTIPESVNIKVTLWNGPDQKSDQEFEFKINIYSPHTYTIKEQKKETAKKSAKEEKEETDKLIKTVKDAFKALEKIK